MSELLTHHERVVLTSLLLSCPTPKLLKFRGRPSDLSPKARFKSWFGCAGTRVAVAHGHSRVCSYTLPFDRHDWIIDRCGTQVRYVIDFYEGPPDPMRPVSVHLDVRPAVSFGGVADRARMFWNKWMTNSPDPASDSSRARSSTAPGTKVQTAKDSTSQ